MRISNGEGMLFQNVLPSCTLEPSQGARVRARKRDNSREGSALLVVLLMAGILLLASTALMALTTHASFRMRRHLLSAKALAIAEAGIADMIGRLSANYTLWQGSTNSTSFADGSFSVVAETLSGGNVLITSRGTAGTITRTASIELLGTDRDRNDMLFSLNGAILSGGDIRFRTAAFTIRGHVHSNQEITSASGAHNGNLFAGIGDNSSATLTAVGTIGSLQGTHMPGAAIRELPEFNFDSYRQLAQDGGIYMEGSQTLANWNGTPANGIVYVNGDVRIRNNSSLVGTLVVNGDIRLENNFTQTAFASGMPAMLSTGNVTMGNRGQIDGLVYAVVNVYIDNNVDVMGGIISGGFTEINNNADIYHPTVLPPWDPLQPAVSPEVIIGGWLQ